MIDLNKITVPVLPIKNSVLFPHLPMPLVVNRPSSIAAIEAALTSEDKTIAVFTQKDTNIGEPKIGDLFEIGTLAVIKKMTRISNMIHIMVQGVQRLEHLETKQTQPFVKIKAHLLQDPTDKDTETEALHRAVIDLVSKMAKMAQPQMQADLSYIISQVEQPLQQAYFITSLLSLDLEKEMALLKASSNAELFQLLHNFLSHEVQVLEMREHIASQVQSKLGREQQEYLLRQQLQAIQEELGEQKTEQADVADLRQRMEHVKLPDAIAKEVKKELDRLERISANNPEYQLTRSYIELVIDLPWDHSTDDILDLDRAQKILDEDHYGLEDVKQRIIEHLAVMKLNPQANAPILCFVGPPGVGKTSVGQSIGRAMGRKFERMSLGGLHDEAELRGHRRTYIGAMPGRIIREIRRAGVKNPLLMLDEVDKLGQDFRGDPAAALMEILDPSQNFEFHDNYVDFPFDLSKVFFITTANTLDSIPKPLLDRMEILRLPGYIDEEKREIAQRYLIARQMQQAGLKPEQLDIPEDTLNQIIRRYTREAGVRELERMIGGITRKVATQLVKGETTQVTVNPENLFDLLGPERFLADMIRKNLPSGVAAGLAWTTAGGDVLYVETALLPEGKGLTLTGQLGDIMQESAKTAQSYIWSHADELGIEKQQLHASGVHIHVPAGAVPKDGPSAGITLAVALASLYSHCPARSDTAMTGEITLSGLVLPVGGIREKVTAAYRSGIRRIILPKQNHQDLRELPEHIRNDITFIQAETIADVLIDAIPVLKK